MSTDALSRHVLGHNAPSDREVSKLMRRSSSNTSMTHKAIEPERPCGCSTGTIRRTKDPQTKRLLEGKRTRLRLRHQVDGGDDVRESGLALLLDGLETLLRR
jgi:hypothetical protein